MQCICSDITNPEKTASSLHKKYNVEELITYNQANVMDLPYDSGQFDIVVFKSVLGALQTPTAQQKAIHEIYRVLTNDGELWFAENLIGSRIHRVLREKFVEWDNIWRYLSTSELLSYLNYAGFKKIEFSRKGFFGSFGRNELQRKILGILDGTINAIIPSSQKYLIYGIAKK